ncbi:MAG: sporulation protein Cse60 [Alicyclobacillus sp.]|nr:sporulation protein Cse60 [Alicyclobacillus sp.]
MLMHRKVKIFTADNPERLETSVNDFLSTCSAEVISDIKFSVSSLGSVPGVVYSALVIYTTMK